MKLISRKENQKLLAPRLLHDERGLSTVEYVILLALIAVGGITVWSEFGGTVQDKVQKADAQFKALPDK